MSIADSPIMITTLMVTDELTDDELLAIYNTGASEWPLSEVVLGHEKAASLFPKSNGNRMHRHTLAALKEIVQERLGVQPV